MWQVARWLAGAAALGGGGFLVLATGVGWWLSSPGHRGPVTEHFDGTVFRNTEPTPLPSFGRAVRMMREGRGPAWASRAVAPRPPPPERVEGDELRVTFVNHATVLVQHDGVNVLTDPIWSDRCSAVQWLGPRRHHAPGVSREDLPPIDLVLISHNHYDHLDIDTLRWLAERDDPVVLAGLGNEATLAGLGLSDVRTLDWEQVTEVGGLRVVGQEVRHFSSRGLFDRQKTLWMGFVVEGDAGRWYFAGDTGYGQHFAQTGARHGPFRLALLPIGAYGPRWFMGPIHMDPQQAVAAHRDVRAAASLGIHHGTFQLTREGQDAPVEEMRAARQAAGLEERAFRALAPGEGWSVP